MRFDRRKVVGVGIAALTPFGLRVGSSLASGPVDGTLLVPGYRSDEAESNGRILLDQPGVDRSPDGWNGPLTLVSKYDLNDPERPPMRAAFPVKGHGICSIADSGLAIFVGMRHDSAVTFDVGNLDLIATARPLDQDATFGGHAAPLPDRTHVLIAERPDRGEGWLSIREAATLKAVGRIPSFGLRPHDVRITDDGRHAVVANYGSVSEQPEYGDDPDIPKVLDPCLAVIDLASGRLLTRVSGTDATAEVRHLLAPRLDRIFAVTTHLATEANVVARMGAEPSELGVDPGTGYLPSLPIRVVDGRAEAMMTDYMPLARHGLSLGWDPTRDEVLITYPTSDVVVVFQADGAVRAVVPTAVHGFRNPSGVVLAPDGRHWVVTGHDTGVLVLDTEFLAPVWASATPRWWGHSHTVLV